MPTKPKQRTVIRYIVKKDEDGAHRESGAQPTAQSTPPREALGSDGSDTPPSEGATPRGQSPAKVDGEGTSQSGPHDEGSTDEAETSHTWPREATFDTHGPREPSCVPWPQRDNTAGFDILSRINTCKYVRLVEHVEQTEERRNLTERQGNGRSTGEADMLPTWPKEATSDTHGPNEQPSDVTLLKGDNTGRYNW